MEFLLILAVLLFAGGLFADDKKEEEKPDDAVMQAHRFFAADYFNKCWELIDKPERTAEENLLMIHRAHASRAHWQAVGNADNWTVGEWQISHVYWLLSRTEPCLVHAREALRICEVNNINGFNLGFAYEAMARASFLAGDVEGAKKYLELGRKAAEEVTKKEDKEYLLKELNSVIPEE